MRPSASATLADRGLERRAIVSVRSALREAPLSSYSSARRASNTTSVAGAAVALSKAMAASSCRPFAAETSPSMNHSYAYGDTKGPCSTCPSTTRDTVRGGAVAHANTPSSSVEPSKRTLKGYWKPPRRAWVRLFDFDARHPYISARGEPIFAPFPRSRSGRTPWVRFG